MNSNNWIDASAVTQVPEGDVVGLAVAGREIAFYKVDGEVFATDMLCTHGNARLCDGFLDGYEIECPLHQGKFDVRNGQPTCAPITQAVRSYPIRIDGARVLIQVSE